jgi:hypothetical protein
MSSGQGSVKVGFNPMQIKDGWIVRLDKNGKVKSRIEEYPRKKDK